VNPLEIFTYAFEALRERRARSVLTILMVVISAALMTALNGMNAGMENYFISQFSSLSPNVLVVIPGTKTGRFDITSSAKVTLNIHDVENIRKVEGVEEVIPLIQGVAVLRSGVRTLTVQIVGFDQSKIHYIYPTVELEEGSYVSPYDSTGIVLGAYVANPPGAERTFAWVGQVVTARYDYTTTNQFGQLERETVKRSFIVRGVLKYTGAPGFANVDRAALVSLQAANMLFRKGGHYDAILVVTKDPELNEQVEKRIVDMYSRNVAVISPKAIVQVIRGAMAGFSTFTVSIAAVSLVVAAVGIITTLFTSVLERTREIGLLKALGFRNWQVLLTFLSEALIVGLLGGSLGVAVGYAGAYLLLMRPVKFGLRPVTIQPFFNPVDLLLIWAFTLAVSLLAGFYPAWRASRLNPVEALRRE